MDENKSRFVAMVLCGSPTHNDSQSLCMWSPEQLGQVRSDCVPRDGLNISLQRNLVGIEEASGHLKRQMTAGWQWTRQLYHL
jgi:hypothetical protein